MRTIDLVDLNVLLHKMKLKRHSRKQHYRDMQLP